MKNAGITQKVYLLLLSLLLLSFCLAGCSLSGVAKEQLISDLQESGIFSVHNTGIEEFNIIKRKTDSEEDVVYVNAKGRNDVYSLSLNFKMTYLMYNDGWHLETVESYADDEGKYFDEIIPLTGPSQAVVDTFIEQQDWKSVASFSGWLEQDVEWELTPTEDIILEPFYGQAKYMCTVICEYPYVIETVTFPVYFQFSCVQDSYYLWTTGHESVVSETERSVDLKRNICNTWAVEGVASDGFSSAYVQAKLQIVGMMSSNEGVKHIEIGSYSFYDGNNKKTYEASGWMKLVPCFDEKNGKISSLELNWVNVTSETQPEQCAGFTILDEALKSHFSYPLDVFDISIYYSPQN